MRSPVWNSFIAALCFTLIGFLVGLYVRQIAVGEGWSAFPLYSGAGSFLTSFAVWRLFIKWRGQPFAPRGAFAGIIISLLAHPVTWFVAMCANWALASRSSLGERSDNPIQILWGVLVLSLMSLLVMGWIAVPAGALVGALVARWQRPRMPSPRDALSGQAWSSGCWAYNFDCTLQVPDLLERLNQASPWVWQMKRFALVQGPHLGAEQFGALRVS